jgi:dipeptidase D
LRLAAIGGGDKHNALPRAAKALVAVNGSLSDLNSALAAFTAQVEPELAKGHELKIIAESAAPAALLNGSDSQKVLNLIKALPHGPLATSIDVPGLIQTSNNLAVVRTEERELIIKCSPRSAVDEELCTVLEQIAAIGRLAGAKVATKVNYPGWKPDASSKVLATALKVSEELFGKPFAVAAIHAGLECGILGAKKPGLDKISFGPDLKSPHSPDESVGIESVQKFYLFLKALIAKIAA